MIIALDIDGTIRDFISELRIQYMIDYPDGWCNEVIKTWELDSYFSIGKDIYKYAFDYRGYEIMKNAEPYIGAWRFVANLKENHDIYLTTTQSEWNCVRGTVIWIDEHQIPNNGLFFTPDKTLLNADILIDDYHVNLNKWAETGRIAICIQRPWNRDIKEWHDNVAFASNYEAVLNLVKYYNKHPEELRNEPSNGVGNWT